MSPKAEGGRELAMGRRKMGREIAGGSVLREFGIMNKDVEEAGSEPEELEGNWVCQWISRRVRPESAVRIQVPRSEQERRDMYVRG